MPSDDVDVEQELERDHPEHRHQQVDPLGKGELQTDKGQKERDHDRATRSGEVKRNQVKEEPTRRNGRRMAPMFGRCSLIR